MKNKTILLIIGIMLVPNIVSAAWWNPFTWFTNERLATPQIESDLIDEQRISTTFYVKTDGARVRKCPTTSCEIVGSFRNGTTITFELKRGQNLKSLPEWLDIIMNNGKVGYINKSLLTTTIPHEVIATSPNISPVSQADVERFRSLYNEVNRLNSIGKKKEAQALTDSLSDNDLSKYVSLYQRFVDEELAPMRKEISDLQLDIDDISHRTEVRKTLMAEAQRRLEKEAYSQSYEDDFQINQIDEETAEMNSKLAPLEAEQQRLDAEMKKNNCWGFSYTGKEQKDTCNQLQAESITNANDRTVIIRKYSLRYNLPSINQTPSVKPQPTSQRWIIESSGSAGGKIWSPGTGTTYHYSCNQIECRIE